VIHENYDGAITIRRLIPVARRDIRRHRTYSAKAASPYALLVLLCLVLGCGESRAQCGSALRHIEILLRISLISE
jgi:hypothetical protein